MRFKIEFRRKPSLRVLIEDEQDRKYVTIKQQKLIRHAILETLSLEGFDRDAEVSVTLTDNDTIREINSEYRGIDAATDVLSFPQYESADDYPPRGFVPLGDIVVSVERAQDQALLYGHSFERELAFLVAHSTLHLLGYDHVNDVEGERIMREKQREVMDRLGLSVTENEKGKETDGTSAEEK